MSASCVRPASRHHGQLRDLLDQLHREFSIFRGEGTGQAERNPHHQQMTMSPALLGGTAGRGLHPLEKRRLVTAHVVSRPSPKPW